tara:strand:- start:323 stop:724 length:402 start_codon:yes stop_codon:yes gene_type:complete
MCNKSLRTNKEGNSLFIAFIITLLIFYINDYPANALNDNWIEVSSTSLGRQYLDKNSLINKDRGIIEITTKYLKIDSKNKNIEENIYRMEINCDANKYKDISINGKNILRAKWELPNGDKLINDVISFSCKNV